MTMDIDDYESRREEAQKLSEQKADEFAEDLKWMMGNPRGRRLAFWLLSEAGPLRTTFREVPMRSQYMALAMAYEEGRKQLGYALFAKLNAICPELYAKMMKESKNG